MPVRKVINIRGIINSIDEDVILVISMISLRRLMDGGAAILIAQKINHHIDIIGDTIYIPFIRNSLRVCVNSYDMLARANRPDDVIACAIIINSAPHIPHVVLVISPANIRPM